MCERNLRFEKYHKIAINSSRGNITQERARIGNPDPMGSAKTPAENSEAKIVSFYKACGVDDKSIEIILEEAKKNGVSPNIPVSINDIKRSS